MISLFNSKKEPKKVVIKNTSQIVKKASATVELPLVHGNLDITLEEFFGGYPTLFFSHDLGGNFDRKHISMTFQNSKTLSEFVELLRDLVIEVNHQKIEMNKF